VFRGLRILPVVPGQPPLANLILGVGGVLGAGGTTPCEEEECGDRAAENQTGSHRASERRSADPAENCKNHAPPFRGRESCPSNPPERYPRAVSARPRPARILDGSSLAKQIREDARLASDSLARTGRRPHLRVVLLGSDPASETYVASKTRAAREAGCTAETVRLPGDSPVGDLLAAVDHANRDASVDGLLVQLPLPPGHDPHRVFDAIDPWKDVDGVTPENAGLLHQDRPRFTPCTPAGIVALLDHAAVEIRGSRAVVLGRSEIVGKPIAALLTARDATVTVCHSRTKGVLELCAQADILIAAIGRPGFVTPAHVRHGAAVVDVGINRVTSLDGLPAPLRESERLRRAISEKGTVLVGDVDFDGVSQVAGWISPVPGGVGPLTVAMLLSNTVLAARLGRERHSQEELDPLTL